MEDMHKNHRERMFKRLKEQGAASFFDHELLEMLLYFSIPRIDTNPTAHRLLDEFESVGGILKADMGDLVSVDGVGDKTALLINIISEIFRRGSVKSNAVKSFRLDNPAAAAEYCKALFTGKKYERFYAICLDIRCNVVSDGFICEGVLDEVPAYSRKIMETVLRHGAHSVVLAHNHPGGDAFPSSDDCIVTENCKNALKTIEVAVRDHIIIGDDGYFSFLQAGKLNNESNYDVLSAAQKKRIIKDDNTPM